MEYFNYHISPLLETVTKGVIDHKWLLELPPAPYNRIYLPLQGDASYSINAHEYIMKRGYAYLIPASVRMLTFCRERCELYWVHYYIKAGFADNFFSISPHVIQRNSVPRDYEDMETLVELCHSHSMHDILIINAILQRFTASFLKPGQPDAALFRFAKALKEIESNVGKNLSVADLARKCGMCPPYFSSVFKKAFGLPPQQYIIRAKINAAIPLLMKNFTLDEIADRLGFHDAFHLSKTFKRITGCSPRQYRAQMQATDDMP